MLQSDLEETLEKATKLVAPYRGKIARIEKIKNIFLVVMFFVFLITAIWVGIGTNNWLWTVFITTIYIAMTATSIYCIKFGYSRALRQSHMLLSLFCRVENNRLFLKLGLEIRPGYLAKWIEIDVVEN